MLTKSYITEFQAVMNFARKSTDGFSIGNILLDFVGGLANYAQMAVQSIDQNSWVNFYGNIGKTLLSLVCDILPPYLLSLFTPSMLLFWCSVIFCRFICDKEDLPFSLA
ncbi:cystinosin-like protein [Gossypium australe]|uniref:Cystinosin-like protein n=1 Tax=Gossypium australe TaxID=47621 RepID=A0A5B6W311_9ROSI|nr:cystinosin-like protein [Gossypium australe]